MVDVIETILAVYLLIWTCIGFGIVFGAGYRKGIVAIQEMQKRQWYRTVGVINSFVVFALCSLTILG